MTTPDTKSSELEENPEDRRAYFRVLTRLPVRGRPVDAEEVDALKEEILRPTPEVPPTVDPALVLWLDRIERKLDRLLAGAASEEDRPVGQLARQETVLSGAGIRFAMGQALEPGADVLVDFELPGPPAHPIRCLGRIVDREPAEGGWFAHSVGFAVIKDADRDAILRHVVAVQRSLLRQRSASETGW